MLSASVLNNVFSQIFKRNITRAKYALSWTYKLPDKRREKMSHSYNIPKIIKHVTEKLENCSAININLPYIQPTQLEQLRKHFKSVTKEPFGYIRFEK
jgi:broad specificity polyphosphatase/5'/3'-nucleotidase SurE